MHIFRGNHLVAADHPWNKQTSKQTTAKNNMPKMKWNQTNKKTGSPSLSIYCLIECQHLFPPLSHGRALWNYPPSCWHVNSCDLWTYFQTGKLFRFMGDTFHSCLEGIFMQQFSWFSSPHNLPVTTSVMFPE